MRILALALAALLSTAGCLGGDDEQSAPTQNGGDDATTMGTNGSGGMGMMNASENATYLQNADYSQEHIHDYWNGAEERVLMDEVVQTSTMNSLFITAFWPFIGGEPRASVGTVWFTLPNNTFVPEGTGELTVEIDATAALRNGQIGLMYRPANDDAFVELDPQPAQASWTVQLTPEMSDLPHAKSTRWFWLLNAEGAGAVLDGDVNVKIIAKKLYDIEAWPEHPDFWHAGHLTRLDLANVSGQFDYADPRTFRGEETTTVKVDLPPGTIVPPETAVLLVTLDYTVGSDAKNNLNGDVALAVKEGSTAGWYRGMWRELVENEEGHKVYALLVDESNQDSPYAAESGWSFELHAYSGMRDPQTGETLMNFGLAELGSGSFTIDIKAFRVVPEWLEGELNDSD